MQGEGFGGSLVRAEPPATRRRLVDGSANERMSKPVAARNIGLADEVEQEEFVERFDCCRLGGAGGGCRQFWVERITCYRGALKGQPRLVREKRELFRERGGDCLRDVDPSERGAVGG